MSSDSLDSLTAPHGSLYFFDREHLSAIAAENAARYQAAAPFPHIVIDDFLPKPVLDELLAEFPGPEELAWHRFDTDQEIKLAADNPEGMPGMARHLLAQFNTATMIDFLEQLTGIQGLIPDPHLWGGGLHQIEPGGHLDIHTDFNWHKRLLLDRRINLLLYLNEDWQEEWGGGLELWDRDMTACQERVLPIANRCVIFSTTDFSLHGHPDPLACPPGRTRRSLALYYYSNGRPADEIGPDHTTAFHARPGETWRRAPTSGESLAARITPPILADAMRKAKRRAQRDRDDRA